MPARKIHSGVDSSGGRSALGIELFSRNPV